MATSTPAQDIARRIQTLSDEYQTLQTNHETTISARQRLTAQEVENTSVSSEFATLPDDAVIYKMVGPVLLKQDKGEAVLSVEGRVGWIRGEIERVEALIKSGQEKLEKKREEIYQLQVQQQAMQQGAGAGPATAQVGA